MNVRPGFQKDQRFQIDIVAWRTLSQFSDTQPKMLRRQRSQVRILSGAPNRRQSERGWAGWTPRPHHTFEGGPTGVVANLRVVEPDPRRRIAVDGGTRSRRQESAAHRGDEGPNPIVGDRGRADDGPGGSDRTGVSGRKLHQSRLGACREGGDVLPAGERKRATKRDARLRRLAEEQRQLPPAAI